MGDRKKKEEARQLTPREAARKEKFDRLCRKMEREGWQRKDLTVGLVFANVMAIVLSIPFFAVFIGAFLKLNMDRGIDLGKGPGVFGLIGIAYLVSIVVHEQIHGITWSLFAPKRWKSISFGFIVQYLTPYCTCDDPLRKGPYICGALAPLVVLGIIPSVISLFNGSMPLLAYGLLMIMSAGGDMTIVLNILKNASKSKEVLYIDHPYQAGGVMFERD
ncbi:MAG: DUF3267 domain-containing protein [Oscillospiraceae bacterium]|nr:DUF3267 domain-containing protein [Oscillospiraceae bacterium]